MKFSKLAKVAVVATVSLALAVPTLTSASAASKFATATSASQAGGLAGLAAGCKAEGQLNVIALPHYWADYGTMIDKFKAKYGVKVDEADPEGSSQDEIDAANRLKGTNRSPDVFDVGLAVASKYLGTGTFAPYKVRNWANNLGATAVPTAEYTPNYTGTMTIGYDGSLGTITKLDDLFKPIFKGKVALNGDPNVSSAGLNGVFMINKAAWAGLPPAYQTMIKTACSQALIEMLGRQPPHADLTESGGIDDKAAEPVRHRDQSRTNGGVTPLVHRFADLTGAKVETREERVEER